jgi:hypothetical protein
VLAHLGEAADAPPLLRGLDGRPGWLTTALSKVRLYDEAARACRERLFSLHDAETAAQLSSIEAATLRAPAGLHDDRAMALVLAVNGLTSAAPAVTHTLPADDPLAVYDRSGEW